jgi:hypothetical protein
MSKLTASNESRSPADRGECPVPAAGAGGATAAVLAIDECRAILDKARNAGRNVRDAEKLLGTAEAFVRSGNYIIGRKYLDRTMRLLNEAPGKGE